MIQHKSNKIIFKRSQYCCYFSIIGTSTVKFLFRCFSFLHNMHGWYDGFSCNGANTVSVICSSLYWEPETIRCRYQRVSAPSTVLHERDHRPAVTYTTDVPTWLLYLHQLGATLSVKPIRRRKHKSSSGSNRYNPKFFPWSRRGSCYVIALRWVVPPQYRFCFAGLPADCALESSISLSVK